MKKILGFFGSSIGLKQSTITVVGNLATTAISAIALIVISRFLGPSKFGEFSVGFSLVLILNRINDFGLSYVVQKYAASEDQTQVNRIFSYTLRLKMMIWLGVTAIGILISGWLTQTLHFSQPLIIYLSFVLSGCTVLYEQLQAMLQALHRFSQVVIMNFIQSVAKLVGSLTIFWALSHESLPVFVWYMFAPLLPILATTRLLPQWVKIDLRGSFAVEKKLISTMARHAAVAYVIAGIIDNVDVLFVQHYLNTYETGLLSGVAKIALVFSTVAFSLGSVLNARVAHYQTKHDIDVFLKKSFGIVAATAIGFLAFLPFARLSIIFTVGEQYLSGQPILNIMVAAAFLTIAVMPFMALFFSFDVPWYFSSSAILQLVIVVVGNMWFVPLYGLVAAAWIRLITRFALLIFTLLVAFYAYRKKYADT